MRCRRNRSEPSLTRGKPGPKRPLNPDCSASLRISSLDFLPFHAKRRVGEHVIEVFPCEPVVGEGVSQDDIGDVLPLDQHVRLTDGVRLRVEFLPVHDEAGIGVHGGEVFIRHGEHSAGTGCRIVDRTDYTGFGESVSIFDKEEVHHEPDDFARSEMFPGGLVGKFSELPQMSSSKTVPICALETTLG